LDVFCAVVDCGGVNAAADHLGIAQPSVTAHLRALESQLGSTLFLRRRGRRNIITPMGEALYKYARDALTRSADFKTTARGFHNAAVETVTMAVERALANYMMPRVLAPFLRGRHSAHIQIHGETQKISMDMLRSGAVDAAILFNTPEIRDEEGLIIGAEPLRIIAAPNHPLAKRKIVPVPELEAFDFIAGLQNSYFYAHVDQILKELGLPRYRVILRMQDSVAIKNAVLHGIGLACTHSLSSDQEIAEGRLVIIKTDPVLPAMPVKLIVRPDAPCRALIDAFIPVLLKGFNA